MACAEREMMFTSTCLKLREAGVLLSEAALGRHVHHQEHLALRFFPGVEVERKCHSVQGPTSVSRNAWACFSAPLLITLYSERSMSLPSMACRHDESTSRKNDNFSEGRGQQDRTARVPAACGSWYQPWRRSHVWSPRLPLLRPETERR